MYEPANLGTNISARKRTKRHYSGPKEEETGLSDGTGRLIYDLDDHIQSYEGKFVWNNMHGYGEYKWGSLRSKYEGQFYANKKEGYGRFSYPSGAYFEGLYLNDRRFGPGVYTDAAGNQDVGIWVAAKLIRLSRCFEPDDSMPRLAVRNEDKIRVLEYREIVDLQENKEEEHAARNLLESMIRSRNYDKSVIARAEELYNPFCKDERTASFNKPKYGETFFGNESDQLTIDVLVTEEKKIQRSKISGEKRVSIQVESLTMKDFVPRVHESIITHDNMGEKLIDDISNSENEESDYCGMKPIDLEKLKDEILMGNHENLWSIFQSSNIIVPRDLPGTSDASPLDGENIKKSNSGENEEEFVDFGGKKINRTKELIVTGLLAWNNSSLLIEVLKHVFKHRNFEKTLSFDISKILAGGRGSFRQEGADEKAAFELLNASSSGFQTEIMRLILKNNVHPDVADGRGNTGLLLAAVGDKLEAIDTLLNLGANVDTLNDECLTPLSISVLRLLQLIHGVTNWSTAFLPRKINGERISENKFANFQNYKLWRGRVSCESLWEQDKRTDKSYEQKYIFDMRPIIRASIPQRKIKNDPTKNKDNKIGVEISRDGKTKRKNRLKNDEKLLRESKQIRGDDDAMMKKVRNTISKLLTRGAEPNFSRVPFPVLIMAIFTKSPSLLSELLRHGADPNTILSKADHSLTPLLILTILQPAKENSLMAKALLKAKANPNLRADPDYRRDLMERLSRNRPPEYLDKSEGPTPLHLLAIRMDIETDVDEHLAALVEVFYTDGCIERSDLYQGHSPLSLAIVEGNLAAAKTFLKSKFINVNEQLGADLGSAMLMLESSALQKLLPPDLLQKFLELMLEYGGCPFASANAFEAEYNQIEYGRKELTRVLTMAESLVEADEKKRKNKSKSSKESVMENFNRSMNFVEKIAREKLTTWIKANFVKDLMNSSAMLLPATKRLPVFIKEPLFNYALNWMTEEEIAIVMKTMNCSRDNVAELVRLFVTARFLNQQNNSSDLKTIIKNETEKIINKVMPSVDEEQQILASANLKVEKTIGKMKIDHFEPELDLENQKFKVCFECFGVHGKILIACPKCERLYFCSEECNSKNAEREANPHQCPIFYKNQRTGVEKIASSCNLGMFKNPEEFINLEGKIGRSKEERGKTGSSKYREENMWNSKAKYRNDELAVYKNLEGSNYNTNRVNEEDQPADKIEYDYDQEKNSANRTEAKEKNKKIVYRDNGIDINSVNENNEDDDDGIRSKNIRARDHRSENNDKMLKDASNEKKSLKNLEENGDDEEKPVNGSSVKVKKENKSRHRLRKNEELVKDETEMKSKKGDGNKKAESVIVDDRVLRNGMDSAKPRKGRKKGSLLDENELNGKISKFTIEKKKLGNKRGDQRANELLGNNNAIVNNAAKRKREGKNNKIEWAENKGGDKKTGEQYPNTWKNKAGINIREIENDNVQAKNFNWLLNVNKSLGERLDIDILLLPYVVFAQGDTYFRILPANRLPKYKGNYSLI